MGRSPDLTPSQVKRRTSALPARQTRLLHQLSSRHGRRKSEFFVCEGLRVCLEAVRQKPDWIEWGVLAEGFADDRAGPHLTGDCFPVYRVSELEFDGFAQTDNSQGVLLVLRRPDVALRDEPRDPFVLVLDRIADPGNLGSILRTAWAGGMRDVSLISGTTDPFGAKAVRAGMGAQFALRLSGFTNLADVRQHYATFGYDRVWVAAPDAGVSCFCDSFDPRNGLLIMGNETSGTSLMDRAEAVTIPMPGGAESLNVAQAAAVLLFEAARRGLLS